MERLADGAGCVRPAQGPDLSGGAHAERGPHRFGDAIAPSAPVVSTQRVSFLARLEPGALRALQMQTLEIIRVRRRFRPLEIVSVAAEPRRVRVRATRSEFRERALGEPRVLEPVRRGDPAVAKSIMRRRRFDRDVFGRATRRGVFRRRRRQTNVPDHHRALVVVVAHLSRVVVASIVRVFVPQRALRVVRRGGEPTGRIGWRRTPSPSPPPRRRRPARVVRVASSPRSRARTRAPRTRAAGETCTRAPPRLFSRASPPPRRVYGVRSIPNRARKIFARRIRTRTHRAKMRARATRG